MKQQRKKENYEKSLKRKGMNERRWKEGWKEGKKDKTKRNHWDEKERIK